MKTAQFTPGPWIAALGEHLNTDVYSLDKQGNRVFIAEFATQADSVLAAAAPAMYEALKDLIGDLGDLHGGSIAELQCHWCGRDYEDEEAGGLCTSDDCPGYIARQAIAQAEGRHPRKEETCK